MAVRHGWVERFHDDELIVPIPQLSVVREALEACAVTIGDRGIEENRVLGLARLSGLTGIARAARELRDDPEVGREVRAYHRKRRDAHPQARRVSDLALVIQGVKLRLAQRYPGWEIAIGKNYAPSVVHGDPHTDGAGRPKPHTDGEGKPTVTGADCTGPIAYPDPHTDVERERASAGEPGRGVRVGLVDTRLFPHENLADRYIGREADVLSPSLPVFTEFDGHCTFVASCILREAPGATLYLRHALNEQGDGTVWDAAAGIADLVPLDLDVVNLSFGEYMTDDDSAPMVLDAAIRRFGRDTVVVASAGNNGHVPGARSAGEPKGVTASTTSYPAALPGVVGVGACDADNKLADFTPRPAPWISLLARGVDVNAAYLRGDVRLADGAVTRFEGFANWAGCSFAAGVVSGVIAARTIPGQRSAREVRDELAASLRQKPWSGLLINPELLIK
jgi:hypothetical protein